MFTMWRARRKVRDWDRRWDTEWHKAWTDIADAPVIRPSLEEERINKEFEKLRKQLERRYAKGRRKARSGWTGKKCPVCKKTVRLKEEAYGHSTSNSYSYNKVIFHRQCFLAYANDEQAIPDLLEGLRLRAEESKDKKYAQGMMDAVAFLAEKLPQHMASGEKVKETKEQKVQREFEELRQRLLQQHQTTVAP